MSNDKIDDPLKERLALNQEARLLFFHQEEYLMIGLFKKGADSKCGLVDGYV